MDVVFNPVMNNNYVKQITTYESSSNFYNSLQESIVYDKKNKEVKKIIVLDDKSMFVVGKFNCFLDGSKKHWVNKILKLKSNGDIDPAFLPGHSATNYTYINGDQNYGSNYVINDRNTGYGFSMLDIAISMAGGSMNLYMSDIKIVDPNGDRIKVDDSGNIVTSGGRFIAYDDEIDIKPIDKSYVSDIIYFNNKILVCGRFNFFRNGDNDYYDVKNIIRLDLDGKVDASFNYSNNALDYFYSIDSIKLVNNGDNILIGGRPKFFNTSVLDSGETKNVFIKIKSDGSLVNGLDNNLKFRYYSVGDLQLDTFITKIPFINKIF